MKIQEKEERVGCLMINTPIQLDVLFLMSFLFACAENIPFLEP